MPVYWQARDMNEAFEPRIGRLLSQSYGLWQRLTYADLAYRGFPEIRPSHSPVFRHIDEIGTRVVDLADRAGITKQSMAYLVRQLEAKGFAEIREDPQDGRARLVVLTERGRSASQALAASSRALEGRYEDHFGSEQLEQLRRSLVDLQTWNFDDQKKSE